MSGEYNRDLSLSNFLLVDECLLDVRRVSFFKNAIDRVVKPGYVVVDGGTGTGIIALFAAKRGARVYAVERDRDISRITEQNVHSNGFSKKIQVINKDIRDFKLPRRLHADVVAMEMLDTWLVAEQQAPAIIALKKNGVITNDTILLPDRMSCLIRIVNYDFDFYDFEIPIVMQARNFGAVKRVKEVVSNFLDCLSIDLKSISNTKIDINISIPAIRNGIINAVELSSDIYLDGRKYKSTSDMNMPVIVPIKRRRVKKGDKVRLNINYQMGRGFGEFKIN
ncbi:MAG: 50S ribosomal protein L11 methyltransferase [Candidatus Colwellbacteria bacterium]|nr:50S ribosomal protein L11 methyltransferase [Candidatus Colwellbacteria bacterium]